MLPFTIFFSYLTIFLYRQHFEFPAVPSITCQCHLKKSTLRTYLDILLLFFALRFIYFFQFRSCNEELMVYERELGDDNVSQWQNDVTVDPFTCA